MVRIIPYLAKIICTISKHNTTYHRPYCILASDELLLFWSRLSCQFAHTNVLPYNTLWILINYIFSESTLYLNKLSLLRKAIHHSEYHYLFHTRPDRPCINVRSTSLVLSIMIRYSCIQFRAVFLSNSCLYFSCSICCTFLFVFISILHF